MLCRIPLGVFVLILLTPGAALAGGIPAKTLKDLKLASVYIKMEFQPPGGKPVAGALNNFDPIDVINGRATNFRCKVYLVRLKAKQKYQIDLTSNQFDPVLRIETKYGKELAFDDDSGGFPNARLIYTPTTDDVYRIVATQFDTRVGGYDLKVMGVK